ASRFEAVNAFAKSLSLCVQAAASASRSVPDGPATTAGAAAGCGCDDDSCARTGMPKIKHAPTKISEMPQMTVLRGYRISVSRSGQNLRKPFRERRTLHHLAATGVV